MPETMLGLRFESGSDQICQWLSQVMRELAPFGTAGRSQGPADLARGCLAAPAEPGERCLGPEGVELVLAEILNNISEHAYPSGSGVVELLLRKEADVLDCRVRDWDYPMSDGDLPTGLLPEAQDMPEGGFGWHIIRALAEGLCYRRLVSCNELRFRLQICWGSDG